MSRPTPDPEYVGAAKKARQVILERLIAANQVGTSHLLVPALNPKDVLALVQSLKMLDDLIKQWTSEGREGRDS